jgi:hypothetical protein
MNNIEQYLYDNPEVLKDFMTNHEKLLNEVKNSFAGFIENG